MIGENIRKRRMALNMSQQELADALGYKTRSSIAKLEKNSSSLSQDKLVTLANVLKTSVSYLVTGQDDSFDQHGEILELKDVDKTGIGDRKRKCAAVVLAGGKNRVNKYSIPFQFITVREKPVIFYTLDTFQRHPLIDEIYVVCLEGWEDFFPAYAEKYGISKLKAVIPAGKTGIESVKNAVDWLTSTYNAWDVLVLQEATRPFVEPEIISNVIRCCKQYGSAVTFERMDSLTPFLVNQSGVGLKHLNASDIINIQSPEAYTMGTLRQAFYEAGKVRHPLEETICAVFLHNLGRKLKFCEGSRNNLRIVYEEDLKIMEAIV